MKPLLEFLCLLVLVLQLGCNGGPDGHGPAAAPGASENCPAPDCADDPPLSTMSKIVGADAQCYFMDEHGNRFFPWGLNYTATPILGLIDDHLESDTAWHIIEEDFAEMKAYSANSVRIHLQYNRFMLDPWTPDPRAFEALDRLVTLAEDAGLYLVITGLGSYRKADSPPWYDNLSTEERWNTQALFWQTVAGRVRTSTAVFAYDLMNEPTVSACGADAKTCDWHLGQASGSNFHFAQNITIEPYQPYRATMTAWMQKLTQAIRSEDRRTLITLGSRQEEALSLYAGQLDFVSPHIYPETGNLQPSIDYILFGPKVGPLVIEEFFNLKCTIEELEAFLLEIEGEYHGLFGHYHGMTLEELADEDTLAAAMWREFLLFFIENNPNTADAPPAEP